MQCYLCGIELNDDNKSREHIIPNALGGKITSSDLLCKKCNNDTGILEESLCRALNFFINSLEIKRGRGKNPTVRAMTSSGKKVLIDPGFKVRLSTSYERLNKKTIVFSCSNKDAARKELTKLSKKYPNINVEEELNKAIIKKETLDSMIYFDLTLTAEALRAITKIILNYSLYKGIKVSNIKKYVNFIKGNSENDVIKMYHNSPIYFYNDNIISVVSVLGSKEQKKIVGYIQMFNFYRFYTILDDDYNGDDFEYPLYFYPQKIEQENIKIKKGIFKENENLELNYDKLKQEINKVISVINRKLHIDRMWAETWEELKEKFPQSEESYFTEEMVNFISRRMAEKYLS